MAQVIPLRNAYYSDFRVNGKRIQRFLSKDRREAQIELGKLIERLRGEASGRPEKDIDWLRFKEKYLDYCQGKKAATAKRDKAAISVLEAEYPHIMKLRQITPEMLDQFKAKRLASGKGKPTVARDISAIKAMMHKAEGWGYVHKQNWATVKKLKVAKKKLYFHSPEELGRLLKRCHGHWRTIAILAARVGLRREEIHTLTWEDVDFVKSRIHITPKMISPGVLWEPKDYEQRFVPFGPEVRVQLQDQAKRSRGRFVIVELNGQRPSLAVMTAYMSKIAKRAGVRGSLHILRHTYASHLVQAGVSLKKVKDLLGHDSMATTEIYAHLAPEHLDDVSAKLPAVPGLSSGASSARNIRRGS